MAPTPPLVLSKATPDERINTWMRHQPNWGPKFTPEEYKTREEQLLTYRLTKDGGLTTWILTHDTPTQNDASKPTIRPILSSLETFRKRAIIGTKDGQIRDVTAHGVASVFTSLEHRRQGHASTMMSLLADTLANKQAQDPGSAEFSILFSDVGKTFYAQQGWMPFPSTHLRFQVNPFTTPQDGCLTLITDDNVAVIAELDEQTIRKKVAHLPENSKAIRVAILPDIATYEWHFARASILSSHLLKRVASVHGALYTPVGKPASRVWMLWTASVPGGKEAPEKNVLDILHFAYEDDGLSDEELGDALEALTGVAHTQAKEWLCPKIDMWNPDERTQRLVAGRASLKSELVVRETSCIASLRWFGEGSISNVEWIDNEKFGWC